MTVSAIARILLNEYAAGKIKIGVTSITTINGFTPEFETETSKAANDPNDLQFNSMNEALDFLNTQK